MDDGDNERDERSVQNRLEQLKISWDEPIISSNMDNDSYTSKNSSISSNSPWEIDLIVENMMSHLSYNSLQSCFSVSWFWRKKAFAESKSRVYIRTIGRNIQDIDKLYAELSSKPTNSMKLIQLMIFELPLHPPLLHESLKLLSLYLHNLTITKHQNPQDLFKALKLLPNLSELNLLPLPLKWEGRHLHYPLHDRTTSEPYIFENIRKIEFLSMYSEPNPNNLSQESCLSDICKIFPDLVALSVFNLVHEDKENFKNGSLKKLNRLKISHYQISINNSLKMLAKLDLKLCRLIFRITTPKEGNLIDVDLFRKFVESQRDTLRLFEIAQESSPYVPCHDQTFCPFPLDLPNLKTLHIQKPFIRNLMPIFNALPSLVEAKISVPMGYNWKGVLPKKVKNVYPNLQILRVDHMEPVMFEDMSEYFPSLKLLQINSCTNSDEGLFNEPNYQPTEPGLISYGQNISICDKCQPGKYNIHMRTMNEFTRDVFYDFLIVERNSKISKALDHWKEIEILIAGNCGHYPSAICFVSNAEIERTMKKSNIEKLGFQGKLHWIRFEAGVFSRSSDAVKPFNGQICFPRTLDCVLVPFDNYIQATIPEYLISQLVSPKTLLGSSYS